MPLAHEVATELRKLADSLDTTPDATVSQAFVSFNNKYEGESAKDKFLAIANAMPKPFKKDYTYLDLTLRYRTPAIDVWNSIMRTSICRLIKPAQPAEFECEPLFSTEEEAQLDHH